MKKLVIPILIALGLAGGAMGVNGLYDDAKADGAAAVRADVAALDTRALEGAVAQLDPVPDTAAPTASEAPSADADVGPATKTTGKAKSTVPLPGSEDAKGWLRAGYDAIVNGDWKIAAGAVLSLLVLGIRRLPEGWAPGFFRTDRGGVVLVLATSLLGGVGHALVARVPITFALVEAIVMVAVIAIGGYQGLKRLVWPKQAKARS